MKEHKAADLSATSYVACNEQQLIHFREIEAINTSA